MRVNMYKHSVHLLPVPVSNLFIKNSSIHGYNTRSCNLLHTKVGSSEVTYTNFSYHGVHIWNIIVQNIPPSISYNSFKHLSKIFIQKNDIQMFVNLNIPSFNELLRKFVFSFKTKIIESDNSLVNGIVTSTISLFSSIWAWWSDILDTHP